MWGDTLEGGDTRVKAIKSDSDSDSDEQKKVARFSGKNRGVTPSLAAPGVTHFSDATASGKKHKRGSDFGPIERYISETVQDRN